MWNGSAQPSDGGIIAPIAGNGNALEKSIATFSASTTPKATRPLSDIRLVLELDVEVEVGVGSADSVDFEFGRLRPNMLRTALEGPV